MKFSCEKALLQAAISTTSRAVSPKSSIPALEGILLEAGNDLRLTGYNPHHCPCRHPGGRHSGAGRTPVW